MRAAEGTCRTSAGDDLRRLVERIEARLGPIDRGRPADSPSLPWGMALLVIDGPLPLAAMEGALESCATWPQMIGAMRRQLAAIGQPTLAQHGLWIEGRADLHRIPHIRRRCIALLGTDPIPPRRRQQTRGP